MPDTFRGGVATRGGKFVPAIAVPLMNLYWAAAKNQKLILGKGMSTGTLLDMVMLVGPPMVTLRYRLAAICVCGCAGVYAVRP